MCPYQISTHPPNEIDDATIELCLAIIQEGGAVAVPNLAQFRTRTSHVAIATDLGRPVGVYTIKRPRIQYAVKIMKKAKAIFPPWLSELGYAAIAPAYRGQGLSSYIRNSVMAACGKQIYGVTSNPASIRGLTQAGFIHVGETWIGRRGDAIGLYLSEGVPHVLLPH